jgi:hypothetical protein
VVGPHRAWRDGRFSFRKPKEPSFHSGSTSASNVISARWPQARDWDMVPTLTGNQRVSAIMIAPLALRFDFAA